MNAFTKNGGIQQNLPKLPECVGGDVDFMIGTKYTRYHPEVIFSLPSGLTIYKSMFQSNDGIQGIIGACLFIKSVKAFSNRISCKS